MLRFNYIYVDENNKNQEWTVWNYKDKKLISRTMTVDKHCDDTINFKAYRKYPEGVIKPKVNDNKDTIYFNLWNVNVANLSEEFQNNIKLYESFMIQSLSSMSSLHEAGITHGNLSPSKIFFKDNKFKIAYFERGTTYENNVNFFKGSNYMISPQKRAWFNDQNIHINFKKEDVYALGLTFLMCYDPDCDISRVSFFNSEELEQFVKSKTRFLSLSIKTVLMKMLAYDHVQRCTMKEALIFLRNNLVVNSTVVANVPACAKITITAK